MRSLGVARVVSKLRVVTQDSNRADCHFVSFAKSGRTWVRLFLNHYYFTRFPLSVTSRSDKAYSEQIPEISYSHGSHYAKDFSSVYRSIRTLRRQKVIFMVRDPRDVFVSYYFQRTRRKRLPPEKSYQLDWETVTMGEMLRDQVFGIDRIVQYMSAWYAALPTFSESLLIQYEQLHRDPRYEFRKLIEFFEQDEPNQLAIERAIEETRFDKMQEREKRSLHGDVELSAGRCGDKESLKVRSGKIGGHLDYLSNRDVAYAIAAMGRLNPELRALFSGASLVRTPIAANHKRAA